MTLRWERKFLKGILYLLPKFRRMVQLVLDTYSGTTVLAKAYLQKYRHRRLEVFEERSMYFPDALTSLGEVYTRWILSPDVDILKS